jgi:hypothetical protein
MKKIALFEDFKISDAGNEDKITSIISTITAGDDSDVTLDLSHCIIDYPATSMLIDKLLNDLSTHQGKKSLTVLVSYFLPEQTLLNDLLGDSKYFGIEAKKEIPIDLLRNKIESCINQHSINLNVLITDRSGKTRAEFKYGN